jgi:hypothetical protein
VKQRRSRAGSSWKRASALGPVEPEAGAPPTRDACTAEVRGSNPLSSTRKSGNQARTTDDAAISSTSGWAAHWALPNVTLDEPIEASHAALVNCQDERLREVAGRHPGLETFLGAFSDEFGNRVYPTVAMIRGDAPEYVRSDTALGGFRDAVCISAIVAGWSAKKPGGGIIHSDAFDIYPWFPGLHGHLGTVTPAMIGSHSVKKLRGQSAPALGRRSLSISDMDRPLLGTLLARWQSCFVDGRESVEDRRLFRALEMGRAASRIPGGVDANEHDAGRAVALWVSAFEILTYKGKGQNAKKVVLSRLAQVEWQTAKLKVQDRLVKIGGKETYQTNVAGEVYDHLNRVRNDFLHGNPVTAETLRIEKCQKNVLHFAAPLFRAALTAALDLKFSVSMHDLADAEGYGPYIGRRRDFRAAQRFAEDAILVADEPPKKRRSAATA